MWKIAEHHGPGAGICLMPGAASQSHLQNTQPTPLDEHIAHHRFAPCHTCTHLANIDIAGVALANVGIAHIATGALQVVVADIVVTA